MKPVVSLIRGEDPLRSLEEAVESLGGIGALFPSGSKVLIKPNLTAALPPQTGAACDLKIVEGLTRMALQAGASRVVIAEAIGTGTVCLKDVKGLAEIAALPGVEAVDLNGAPTRAVKVKDPLRVKTFEVPLAVLDADIRINLAKLKTHPSAAFSLVMKNLMGALPGLTFRDPAEARKLGYPTPVLPGGGKKVFHDLVRDHGLAAMQEAFVDLNSAIPSHLCLIDALYAMEGPGAPVNGKPVKMDLLIAGKDLVAVEAVGMAVMGFDPLAYAYLRQAALRGLGAGSALEEIEIRGEEISAVRRPFEPSSAASLWPPGF